MAPGHAYTFLVFDATMALISCELIFDVSKNLAKAANNPNVARYFRNVFPYPYSLQDAIDFINFATNNKDELIYGIIINGKASGCLCARFGKDVFEKSCSLGYWLGKSTGEKAL